jgi:hypothetical protein
VTRFEPRTPHQPEKLKKLSKNEYVFTPSIFFVNENYAFVSTPVFNRVHDVHRHVTGNGAAADPNLAPTRVWRGFTPNSYSLLFRTSEPRRAKYL